MAHIPYLGQEMSDENIIIFYDPSESGIIEWAEIKDIIVKLLTNSS